MKTKGEILSKNNLTVDLVHDKVMTERIYKAMDEYTSDAIVDHEAKKWHPYPKEKPKKGGKYLVTCYYHTLNEFIVKIDTYFKGFNYKQTIAFRELPDAYQPKEGGEG